MSQPTKTTCAESLLLGSIIRDGLTLPAGLIPSDFIEPLNQEVAAALVHMAEQGTSVDDLTTSIVLRDRKATAQAHYVNELTSAAEFRAYNPAWADEVRRLAVLRRIAIATRKATELASDSAANPEAVLAFLDGSLKATASTAKPSGAQDDAIPMPLDDLEAFDRENDPNCVIGKRWLCKGGSCFLVSQSGVGKSSFSLQFMISLALKRSFFGIEAKRPLRVVIAQRENDFGDVAEPFADIVRGMNLHQPERAMLSENLFIYRLKRVVGKEFVDSIKMLVLRHSADVVLIDPLTAFAGIKLADQEQVTGFCRDLLDPMLSETGVVLFAVHHTNKPANPKDKAGQTSADLAYAGSGAADFVNYFREVAVLQRCQGDEPIFKFSLTKRRGRSDLRNELGDYAGEIYVRHSPIKGVIRWERSSPPEPADGDSDSKPAKASRRQF